MALVAKILRQYNKEFNGEKRTMYVYTIHGSASEVEEYINSQGENCQFQAENPDVPLLFTSLYVQDEMPVRYSSYNNRYALDTNFAERLLSQAKYFGAEESFKESYGKMLAQQLSGMKLSQEPTTPKLTQTVENEEEFPFE